MLGGLIWEHLGKLANGELAVGSAWGLFFLV